MEDEDAFAFCRRFLKEGRYGDARAILDSMEPEHPSYARARHLYAQSFLAEGLYPRFLEECRVLVRAFPKSGQAYHLSGVAHARMFLWDEAVAAFRRAIALNPQDAASAENLGIALDASGWHRESYAQLRRSLTRTGKLSRAALLALIRNAFLLGDNRTAHDAIRFMQQKTLDDEAVMHLDARNAFAHSDNADGKRLLDRAAKKHTENADILADLGIYALASGDTKKAGRLLRKALSAEPHHAGANYVLADMGGGHSANALDDRGDRLEDIETGISMPGIPYLKRAELGFAAGKILDSLGRYDEAFDHYDVANKMIWARLPKEAAGLPDEVAAVKTGFGKSFFENTRPVTADCGKGMVFLVGMPRSGTTVLEQILSGLEKVSAGGESGDISRLSQTLSQTTAQPTARTTAQTTAQTMAPAMNSGSLAAGLQNASLEELQAWGDRMMKSWRKVMPEGTWRTSKEMQLFLHLGLIVTLFPAARIIHCRRNPMDTCVSAYFQFFKLYHQQFSFHLETLARYYRAYDDLMVHWKSVLPTDILDVDYEELTAEPATVGQRISDFCGFGWSDTCLDFRRSDRMVTTASIWQVRQGMNRRSVARWRRYEKHLAPLIDGLGNLVGNQAQTERTERGGGS